MPRVEIDIDYDEGMRIADTLENVASQIREGLKDGKGEDIPEEGMELEDQMGGQMGGQLAGLAEELANAPRVN